MANNDEIIFVLRVEYGMFEDDSMEVFRIGCAGRDRDATYQIAEDAIARAKSRWEKMQSESLPFDDDGSDNRGILDIIHEELSAAGLDFLNENFYDLTITV